MSSVYACDNCGPEVLSESETCVAMKFVDDDDDDDDDDDEKPLDGRIICPI